MTPLRRLILAVLFALATLPGASVVRGYGVSAHTGPGSDTRLFVSAATMTPSPTGTLLWFVADLNLDGVPTTPLAGQILGPDDQLVFTDVVGGGLLGQQPGRLNRTTNVTDAVSNANIIVYLWNLPSTATPGLAGQTFGITNLGVVLVPPFGNADWLIGTSLFADAYEVLGPIAAVPEPAALILTLAGAWLARSAARRFRPKPTFSIETRDVRCRGSGARPRPLPPALLTPDTRHLTPQS